MRVAELPTPAAVVDLDVLEANARRMAERLSSLGVRLRPHVKTHKCVEAARVQVEGHFGGITVSTLAEARAFARAGFGDLVYAVPLPPGRIGEALDLARRVDRFAVLVDHEAVVAALAEATGGGPPAVDVLLKVDCGYHRAGVDPASERAVRLARSIAAAPGLRFRGILTHAGHAYHARSPEEIRRVAREERDVMTRFAARLREAGIPVEEVSVGSTPTMAHAEDLAGVTEARPGNYVLFDRFQAAIGSCRIEDIALRVEVTVTSHYPERGEMLVDAGALALSRDPGPTHVDGACGFGLVVDAADRRPREHLRLAAISQEHGKIAGARPADFERWPVGARLAILPNHSCLTAAAHDRLYVARGDTVVDEWRPVRGW